MRAAHNHNESASDGKAQTRKERGTHSEDGPLQPKRKKPGLNFFFMKQAWHECMRTQSDETGCVNRKCAMSSASCSESLPRTCGVGSHALSVELNEWVSE
jgi:hypothetical protein